MLPSYMSFHVDSFLNDFLSSALSAHSVRQGVAFQSWSARLATRPALIYTLSPGHLPQPGGMVLSRWQVSLQRPCGLLPSLLVIERTRSAVRLNGPAAFFSFHRKPSAYTCESLE